MSPLLWRTRTKFAKFGRFGSVLVNRVSLLNIKFHLFSFAPTDQKIATCSDDGSVRIFDFASKTEERELRGMSLQGAILAGSWEVICLLSCLFKGMVRM